MTLCYSHSIVRSRSFLFLSSDSFISLLLSALLLSKSFLLLVTSPLFSTYFTPHLLLPPFHYPPSIGQNQIPQPAVLNMIELFETRIEGQVNYLNFLEYVRECGTASALDTLAKQLHRYTACITVILFLLGVVLALLFCIFYLSPTLLHSLSTSHYC